MGDKLLLYNKQTTNVDGISLRESHSLLNPIIGEVIDRFDFCHMTLTPTKELTKELNFDLI